MAKRQFHLTEEEMNQFRHAEQATRDTLELRHLQAVRLYGSGMKIGEIMRVVNAGESSIRQWVIAYQRQGLAGLKAQWVGGNNRKLSTAQVTELKAYVQQYRPVDVQVSQAEYWTMSDLRVVVEQRYGVVYKDTDSYVALLHASGFSYQRSAKVYRHKPSLAHVVAFEAELEKK
jgi:transposase